MPEGILTAPPRLDLSHLEQRILEALSGSGYRVAQGDAPRQPAGPAHLAARRGLAGLLALALESGDARLDVRIGTLRVVLEVGTVITTGDKAEEPPSREGYRTFNADEQAIVEALRGEGWMTSQELAGLLGRDFGTAFRCTLRGLKKRGVIELMQRHGVRLCADGDAEVDAAPTPPCACVTRSEAPASPARKHDHPGMIRLDDE
jgi:hypothetical protein